MNKKTLKPRQAMTIIELLVVISILAIISAILVPQLRIANEDRNLREAARMVGSMFAQASQRAVNDGESGILIERNPNIVDPGPDGTFDTTDDVFYAGTTLFICRRVPNYRGDDEGSQAQRVSVDASGSAYLPGEIFIPLPLESGLSTPTPEDDLIRVNDTITFNSSDARFIITRVAVGTDRLDGNRSKLQLSIRATSSYLTHLLPQDAQHDIGEFKIYRQPRRLESSRVDLPDGYMIDFRGSGELQTNAVLNAADPNNPPEFPRPFFYENNIKSPVVFLYTARGGIDRHSYGGDFDDGSGTPALHVATLSRLPVGQQYLLVRKYGVHEGEEDTTNLFSDESSVWVTVDNNTGASNVVYTSEVTAGAPLSTQIAEARTIAAIGQSASQ